MCGKMFEFAHYTRIAITNCNVHPPSLRAASTHGLKAEFMPRNPVNSFLSLIFAEN